MQGILKSASRNCFAKTNDSDVDLFRHGVAGAEGLGEEGWGVGGCELQNWRNLVENSNKGSCDRRVFHTTVLETAVRTIVSLWSYISCHVCLFVCVLGERLGWMCFPFSCHWLVCVCVCFVCFLLKRTQNLN